MWEKARKVGGRATSKSLSESEYDTVDIGMQYITKKDHENDFMYDKLLAGGVIKPLDINTGM